MHEDALEIHEPRAASLRRFPQLIWLLALLPFVGLFLDISFHLCRQIGVGYGPIQLGGVQISTFSSFLNAFRFWAQAIQQCAGPVWLSFWLLCLLPAFRPRSALIFFLQMLVFSIGFVLMSQLDCQELMISFIRWLKEGD